MEKMGHPAFRFEFCVEDRGQQGWPSENPKLTSVPMVVAIKVIFHRLLCDHF